MRMPYRFPLRIRSDPIVDAASPFLSRRLGSWRPLLTTGVNSTRKLKTQDGRHLRRYERRWLVERFFAWLRWKQRLLIRWKYYATNFLGFVQLACITLPDDKKKRAR